MKTIGIALAGFLTLSAAALAQDAPPADEAETRVEAVAGGQYVNDVDGRGEARFNEFRDVQEGVVLEFGRFSWTPKQSDLALSFTLVDALQDDQRYFLELADPAKLLFKASFVELPRFYSSGSTTLWSGAGTGSLTLGDPFRQAAETLAGSPTSPFASPALVAYMNAALADATRFDLRTERKDLKGSLDFKIAKAFTLSLSGRYETREGTRPLGFGTYIRRQSLSGVLGTGAGSFWRETVEVRGNELIEPLDYKTTEMGVTLAWARKGHSASAGWFGSRFRNDITALYFDNPFEAPPGRASATIFDPRAEQEPAAPNGSNNLRGLYARSATQLWPENDYERIFANLSLRLGEKTRLNATAARGSFEQDDPFLPYAENTAVVFSQAGQPLVYAKDAALPRASLDGKMETTQADLKATSRLTDALSVRAGYRYYELDDQRPEILFPGYSSSGDSFFRAGVGQKDAAGNRVLFNEIGGYTRQRLNLGAAYRFGGVTLDGEYVRTGWDYEARQVDKTTDDAFKGTLRFNVRNADVNVFYLVASRDFEGDYEVGLETSGVRAYDVWTRDRDQFGVDVSAPVGENVMATLGASYWKDEYPGAVEGFAYGYGLQDSKSGSFYAGATYAKDDWLFGGWAGYDQYEWNSLQVTKTSLTTDYNPTNRWTRASSDDVYWIGCEAVAPLGKKAKLRADLNYQKFAGDWTTENLGTPDVNSAVAYPFPELSDSTLTARASLLWELGKRVTLEARYWYEPYRLDDFTWDVMQPYMQGVFQETRRSASDLGPMNVSRFLFLDSRYADYTAHVLSALVHVRF
ncbi:MAG TPA: MtrB/PioB family outer membrane beta-barrel protein [Vicinamibacteria bacterium]|nr:MtrB/PioB family outer membrane beta-barrel protein [Vicinamibacteria bacterium]